MKHYSTIFLDWNSTLSYSKFWGHWQRESNPYNNIFNNIQSTLFSISSAKIKDWMRGKYSTEQIVEFVAKHTEQNYKLLLSEFIKSCQQMEYSSFHIPQLIKQLRAKGIKVLIATDNVDSFTRWTVPALKLDILFDDILNSYNLRVLKTDIDEKGESLFFKKGLKKNFNFKGSVLIDDNLDVKSIVKKSNIDFLYITKENELERHLEKLLNG